MCNYDKTKLNNKCWVFNEEIIDIFPEMLERSIPGYSIIIYIITMLLNYFVTDDTYIYDMGCSLGEVTLSINKKIKARNCEIIAIDKSEAMINSFKKKLVGLKLNAKINIIEDNICNIPIKNASMVILNFTLQFLSLHEQKNILQSIYTGLNSGGVLILSEKFKFSNRFFNKIICNLHHDFKKNNGYSEKEILEKKSMLKKVMLIDTIENHKKKLIEIGFNHIELLFQYLNFGSLLAIKK